MRITTWARAPGSAVLVLGVLVFLSACGADSSGGGATSPPSTAASGDQQPGPATTSGPAQTTISGVLIEGLRPTCRVLQTSQRRYALTGPATQHLKEGDKVTVTGVERSDLVNPCGLTFVVDRIG